MKISKIIRKILFLPWTIYFNFHYFPFKIAIKMPVRCLCRIVFVKAGGTVQITGPIHSGMIILGGVIVQGFSEKKIVWKVEGNVVFHGYCTIREGGFVNCNKNALLEFGSKCLLGNGVKIIADKHIGLGDKIRVSWDCTFIDTDFHPLIDIIRGKEIKQAAAITIESGCWIGHNCIISKGTYLAKNTTVASGAVVKSRIKRENCIVAGNLGEIIDEGFVRDDCLEGEN